MSETEAQTTKKRTKKDDYIVQGSILAAAAVLTANPQITTWMVMGEYFRR